MTQGDNGTFRCGLALWNCLALQRLGWRPDDFWQATPAELIVAIQDPRSLGMTEGPSRDLINQMLERDTHE